MTPVNLDTDNKTRWICTVDDRWGGENRQGKGRKNENNIEGIIEGVYVQNEELGIEIHCRLVEGVDENTADLCKMARSKKGRERASRWDRIKNMVGLASGGVKK